jgi:hypothetical protein
MLAFYHDQYISKYYSFPSNINYFYYQLRMSEDLDNKDDEVKSINRGGQQIGDAGVQLLGSQSLRTRLELKIAKRRTGSNCSDSNKPHWSHHQTILG